jgi:hypothetical protein
MYTIAYQFGDTYVTFGGLQFAIRLSTTENIYCPSPDHVQIKEFPNQICITADQLCAAGGQLTAEGSKRIRTTWESWNSSIMQVFVHSSIRAEKPQCLLLSLVEGTQKAGLPKNGMHCPKAIQTN